MARKKLIKKLHRLHDLFRGCGFTATEAKKRREKKKLFSGMQTRFDVSAESALDSSKPTKL
ncbi:Hypothetical protein FKW44_019946 [Caligus rogercresseyi]|uniref:Uncharacterized protein n=1 Tax=Caligus rogercresseyi TaxID=217165 RepID=A0A7T8GX66_CALRO|nr:Hypothetical protein FKW44_019946 [Caligus rogercresseyi]